MWLRGKTPPCLSSSTPPSPLCVRWHGVLKVLNPPSLPLSHSFTLTSSLHPDFNGLDLIPDVCEGEEFSNIRYVFYTLCDIIGAYPPIREAFGLQDDVIHIFDLSLSLMMLSVGDEDDENELEEEDGDDEDGEDDDDSSSNSSHERKPMVSRNRLMGIFKDSWFILGDERALGRMEERLGEVTSEDGMAVVVSCVSECLGPISKDIDRINNGGGGGWRGRMFEI